MPFRVIGLTGGIASGKSTVSAYLQQKSIPVIDADLVAKETEGKGTPCLEDIIRHFGPEYMTDLGELDRKKLGSLVFSDAESLNQLNQIVKPYLLAALKEQIAFCKEQYLNHTTTVPFVILDCALLTEDPDYRSLVDEIWLVHTEENVRLHRLMQRNGISEEDALHRIQSQTTEEARIQIADFIIDNNHSREDTIAQLEKHLSALRCIP